MGDGKRMMWRTSCMCGWHSAWYPFRFMARWRSRLHGWWTYGD